MWKSDVHQHTSKGEMHRLSDPLPTSPASESFGCQNHPLPSRWNQSVHGRPLAQPRMLVQSQYQLRASPPLHSDSAIRTAFHQHELPAHLLIGVSPRSSKPLPSVYSSLVVRLAVWSLMTPCSRSLLKKRRMRYHRRHCSTSSVDGPDAGWVAGLDLTDDRAPRGQLHGLVNCLNSECLIP